MAFGQIIGLEPSLEEKVQQLDEQRLHEDAQSLKLVQLELELGNIYLHLSQWEQADTALRRAIAIYENNDASAKALAIMQVRDRFGRLRTEREILALVSAFQQSGLPYQAAKRMEAAIRQQIVEDTQANALYLMDLWDQARMPDKVMTVYKRIELEPELLGEDDIAILANIGETLAQEQDCVAVEGLADLLSAAPEQQAMLWFETSECFYFTRVEMLASAQRLYGIDDCRWVKGQGYTYESPNYDAAQVSFAKAQNSPIVPKDRLATTLTYRTAWRKLRQECETRGPRWDCGTRRDQCYLDIHNAYESMVFTKGKLVLSDPDYCVRFVQEYLKEYRPTSDSRVFTTE